MTSTRPDMPASDDARGVPSFFKYVIIASALCIAGCSAFFSVMGLGMLFVGAATAVMVMAASLEVGKLVSAAFLYRYWRHISLPFKIYLTIAVLVLICITSLGNYGYLARAYERTHTEITLLENQIATVEAEIADTQQQIDGSRGMLSKTTDNSHEDEGALNKRVTEANDSLNQGLDRIQEERKAAQERRDGDLKVLAQKMADLTAGYNQVVASENAAVSALNDRVAVMDREVDAYTKEGGAGFLKPDSIEKGQELRDSQKFERMTIATQMAQCRANIEQLQNEQAQKMQAQDAETAAVRARFGNEMVKLDGEEKDMRDAHVAALVGVQQQLYALKSESKATVRAGDAQVDTFYQRIRDRNDDIRRLREQIAGVDIGSYRFVARAFEAPADDVVKWLMLALVLVFDPLAVSLVVGFNIVLLGERRARSRAVVSAVADETQGDAAVAAGFGRSLAVPALTAFTVIALTGAVVAAGHWAMKARRHLTMTSHAVLVPPGSFAVLTLHPPELRQTSPMENLAGWFGKATALKFYGVFNDLAKSGIDPDADVYAFAKFPSSTPTSASAQDGHLALLCGIVVRVTDQAAAEMALSRMADQLSSSLLGGASKSPATPVRSRTMIRCGDGRYMDPDGEFFTFGLRDNAAIILIEFDGSPSAPCVEDEMRLCLNHPTTVGDALSQPHEQLPSRAFTDDSAIALWFDAAKFFRLLPKSPADQARYEQLQRFLAFDLLLRMRAVGKDQLKLTADYVYQCDRFKDSQQPDAPQVLARLGPADGTGLGGRLMDRCADTLDYDSLIDWLRSSWDSSGTSGAQQLLIEKTVASDRTARFTVSARYKPQVGPPLVVTMQTLFR